MQAQEELAVMIKGKRSKRPRPASPLSLTIATTSSTTASSPSNSDEIITPDEEEEDMANCLILLAKGESNRWSSSSPPAATTTTGEVYQCKTCSKSFLSFQALGGHRASHKKPNKTEEKEKKAAVAVVMREKQEDFGDGSNNGGVDDTTILFLKISNSGGGGNKSRVHECSICGAEFGSGQALGGHMRRHRPIPTGGGGVVKRARNLLSLDLNLPAPEDEQHTESKFPFSASKQVIVFSASPLIDCHY